MKLLLSSFLAAFLFTPIAFASDCDKCKDKDKETEEGTLLAGKCKDGDDCDKDEDPALAGKCDKCDDEEKKEEGTLAGKCKDGGDCDKDKDEDPALAHCGKCKGDKEHDEEEEKKEGTLA
jgi:hypothetical protein